MEEMIKSPFAFFADVQETYEEAVQKSADENKSFAKTKHFRMDSAGTYPIRILPLAPTQQPDGSYIMERKGYEYPTKTQLLKLENEKSKSKKDKYFYVPIVHSSFSGISVDLMDTYIKVATEMYADDEKLVKKIKSGSFEGGLKWNYQRAMYIIDLDNEKEGIQLLSLSNSQYKDLEAIKLLTWEKLVKQNPKAPCPISSFANAYAVEITRKEENGKTSYSFSIDTISGAKVLTEENLKSLMDMPRLPEVLYRYTRYQLEATIAFLKQYDANNDINVMDSEEIKDAIVKIGLKLPADDKSHFSMTKSSSSNEEDNVDKALDNLWNKLNDLEDAGLDEDSDEYKDLRDDICNFTKKFVVNVYNMRSKTNKEILEDIERKVENGEFGKNNENLPEDESDQDEEDGSSGKRNEYNEDTNEPALQSRRASRPSKRSIR